MQQQQDGGDQRAGVADADPPDEVDDREAPADRDVDAPDADADDEQVGDRRRAAASPARTTARSRSTSRAVVGPRQHDRADLVGDRAEACGPARGRAGRARPDRLLVAR